MYPREALRLTAADGILNDIIDALFFASLGEEEGAPTRIRVVYHKDGVEQLLRVRDAVPAAGGYTLRPPWDILPLELKEGVTDFSVETIRKIAPAVVQPRSHIVLASSGDQVIIKGIAYRLEYTFYGPEGEDELVFIRVPKPGHLILTRNGIAQHYEDGRWTRILRLGHVLSDEKSIIRAAIANLCGSLINDLPTALGSNRDIVYEVLHNLVGKMAQTGHGGLIAISPEPPTNLGKYQFARSARTLLSARLRRYVESQVSQLRTLFRDTPQTLDDEINDALAPGAEESLEGIVTIAGRLTAVDNALLLGPNLEMIAAGYPITVDSLPPIWEVFELDGKPHRPYPIDQHGSRHRAAASFAYQNPGGIVFWASQDGALRCFHRPQHQDHVCLWHLRLGDE